MEPFGSAFSCGAILSGKIRCDESVRFSVVSSSSTRFSAPLRFAFALLWLALIPVQSLAEGKQAPQAGRTDVSQCAKVVGSARAQGYGYTHLVTLTNGCDRPVWCEVWTDVDPSPQYVLRAGAGQTDEVATRKGSPAREVRAESRCRFE